MTFNANGIRSAARKGFFDWLATEQSGVDVICIQETKAQLDQLDSNVFHPQGYYCYYFDAQKKGYSGVAVYSRIKPQGVHYGLNCELSTVEGRYLQLDFEHISIASLYMPSGSSGDVRQQCKFDFLSAFYPFLQQQALDESRQMIVCA
ncbi:MAG: exodeoxyribonuclease III, partial [Pseudomonadota bacterium]